MPWMAIVGAGLGLSVAGQINEAQQREQYIDNLEARTEFEQAAADQADIVAQQDREARLRRILATQRAMFGASGIDPNSGSAAALRNASIGEASLEQMQDETFGRIAEEARRNRLSALDQQKDYIRGARNIGIGSTVAQTALRYRQI